MHVLSVADIQLIVDLYETRDVVRDATGRERQIDSLVRMGYLRPMRGIFTLTELGEKTARSLQARRFVPSRVEDTAPALENGASGASGASDAADTKTEDAAAEPAAA